MQANEVGFKVYAHHSLIPIESDDHETVIGFKLSPNAGENRRIFQRKLDEHGCCTMSNNQLHVN